MLPITFDPAKDALNRANHRVSLIEAARMEWATCIEAQDMRHDHEVRMVALGYIGNRLHVCVYVDRPADMPTTRRVISLRKANQREERRYAQTQA